MHFLNVDIGSAKDNIKSPVHNWYKFTAGFSYKFVDEIISLERLRSNSNDKIFEPFAGCGTTLVSSQKAGVKAIGNEGQQFMFDIIKAKLNWDIQYEDYKTYLGGIEKGVRENNQSFKERVTHELLDSLYDPETLETIYLIRNLIYDVPNEKYKIFFKLALSQTLHKVSINPIAVPYISRKKKLIHKLDALSVFKNTCGKMFLDVQAINNNNLTSEIYLHDSRKKNSAIDDDECNLCITSPPYLNNLDYGEVSKVHSHFFEITNNWNDITKTVRQQLVTGATTHYRESEFSIEEFEKREFYINNKEIADNLIETSLAIKKISKLRKGKKSFDILMLLYFQDMYDVLKEIRRVLSPNSKSYLILGDSAPYGVFIPTTEILGKIALNSGFKEFKIHKIRTRGTKWKDLTYRHNLELSENVLVLK